MTPGRSAPVLGRSHLRQPRSWDFFKPGGYHVAVAGDGHTPLVVPSHFGVRVNPSLLISLSELARLSWERKCRVLPNRKLLRLTVRRLAMVATAALWIHLVSPVVAANKYWVGA